MELPQWDVLGVARGVHPHRGACRHVVENEPKSGFLLEESGRNQPHALLVGAADWPARPPNIFPQTHLQETVKILANMFCELHPECYDPSEGSTLLAEGSKRLDFRVPVGRTPSCAWLFPLQFTAKEANIQGPDLLRVPGTVSSREEWPCRQNAVLESHACPGAH